MNPEMPEKPQDELEASLTALLLGELPHEQAAALHQKLAQDAELAKLYERLKQTINLVRETVAKPAEQTGDQPTPLKLSDQRRQKLLRHFKTVAPKEFARPHRRAMPWLIPVGIAAGFVVILGGMFLPAFTRSKGSGPSLAFRTWSLSKDAEPVPMGLPIEFGPRKHEELNRNGRKERFGSDGQARAGGTANAASLTETPPSAKPAGTAIVLPNSTELADASSTARVTYSGQPEYAIAARSRGFYDDSSGFMAGGEVRGTGSLRLQEAAENPATLGYAMTAGEAFKPTIPAAIPPPVASAPAQDFLNAGTLNGVAPVPPNALTEGAPADALEVAKAPLQLRAKDKAAAELAAKGVEIYNLGAAAAGAQNLNYQWHYDASTQHGLANADGEKAPILGDVPAAGRLYRLDGKTVGGGVKAKIEPSVTPPTAAWGGVESGVAVTNAVLAANAFQAAPPQLLPAPSVPMRRGYVDRSGEWNIGTGNGNIILPSAPGELNLALKNRNGPDEKNQPYLEAKRNLEELQRFRQILDLKIASEKIDTDLPKTMMAEIVDKAVAQPTQSPTLGARIRGALGGQVERSARVKLERDQPDIAGMADRGKMDAYDPYFIQSEFELMQSEAVLGKVIDSLNLKEAWAKKRGGGTLTTAEALGRLKKSLALRPVPNSSLIDVGVKSEDPDEAARIANAVAEAYRDRRLEQRKELSAGGIKNLEEGSAKLEQKVREAQQKVDDLRKELSIPQTNETDVAPPKPTAHAAIPQPEIQTSENAFSTFSLNVSDVSFKLAGASLEKGAMPEPATVRSEEFINAFDYRDPEPPPGVPVAFAWERARYPFAQNRDLLRFSIKTAALGRQAGRPLNLVLLLDNSGSMERADRVQIIREALRVLAGQLQAQDKFSVVTSARTARLWVDGVPGNQAAQVVEEVSGLTPQGGTNLEDAMNLAYQTALRHYLANGVNRVVLLTDGAANLGNVDPEALKQKVEANRKQGIALDCFGIGWEGYNDDLLEVLSRNGDGRYGFVNTPEEAATEFAGQLAGALHVAASDVKVQVEFNPARVTASRQIGYAKHQLTKEQFRDNTVNAAQIGAAESGNALYVIAVNPGGEGPLAIVRARYRVPGTSDYREHEWPVPYTGNAAALEQASPAMRLAATASALSEWLVSSPYAGEVTPDRLLGYLRGVPEVYGADARPKKLEWMIRQAKSIAGR